MCILASSIERRQKAASAIIASLIKHFQVKVNDTERKRSHMIKKALISIIIRY